MMNLFFIRKRKAKHSLNQYTLEDLIKMVKKQQIVRNPGYYGKIILNSSE